MKYAASVVAMVNPCGQPDKTGDCLGESKAPLRVGLKVFPDMDDLIDDLILGQVLELNELLGEGRGIGGELDGE